MGKILLETKQRDSVSNKYFQSKMYAKNPYVSSESSVFSLGSPMVDVGLSTEEKCEPIEGAGVISVSLPMVAPAREIEVSANNRYFQI